MQLWPMGKTDWLTETSLLVFVPLLLLVSYLHGMVTRILQVFFQQRTVVLLTAVEIVFKVAVVLLLGGSSSGAQELLAAATFSELFVFILAGLMVWKILATMRREGTQENSGASSPGWKELLVEGRPTWLLAMSERILGRDVDILLLGILAGPLEVAKYALPFSLATISISVATSVFQSTTNLSTFTEVGMDGGHARRRTLLKALFEFWTLFVMPIALGGVLVGNRILHLLYGEAADGCGAVTALLFAAFAFSNLAGLAKDALQGMGDDRRPAKVHLMGGVLNLGLSLLLIPRFGAMGAATATLVAAVMIALMQVLSLPDEIKVLPSMRPAGISFLALGTMALVITGSSYLTSFAQGSWGMTAGAILAGIIAYFGILMVMEPQSSLRQAMESAPPALRWARRVL